MQLQGRDLSFGMQGEDVELLQTELGDKLGHQIARDEIQQQRFGQTTRRAVVEFQKQLGQETTGVVNEQTATLINQAVNAVFVVQGVVKLPNGMPLPGILVRASDVDLRSRQIVAEGITNEQGSYKITYGFKDFRSRDMRGPDLIVAAFTPDGDPLSDSEPEPKPKYNAGTTETIDLVVQPPKKPALSESERLLDALSLWPDVRPADLNNDDLDFLENEFAGKPLEVVITEPPIGTRSLFAMLAHAAQIAQQTPSLPTEFFYGVARWLRLDPDFDVHTFLTRPPSEIRNAFLESIEKNIIPAKLRESLNAIVARLEQLRLEQGILVQREFVGRLIRARQDEAEPVEPLAGYTVRVFDSDTDPEPRELGYDITNKQGLFTFVYTAPGKLPDGEEEVPGRKFRLQIADLQGQELAIDPPLEIQVQADQRQVLDVPIPPQALPQPPVHPLHEVVTTLELELPDALRSFFEDQNINIRTLEDIRKKSGLRHLLHMFEQENENHPVNPDDPAIQTLDAHANLSILSPDVKMNAVLIDAGFTSITDIASVPRAEFVTKLHAQLGDFKAAQLHEMTKAQVNFLNSEFMGFKAEFANGRLSGMPEALRGRLPDWFQIKCQCDECEAAVSPLAYLADLLNYAVSHVREAEAPITLTSLSSTFHQPFPDLPASCEEMKKHIRQIRICIEVLRSYLSSRPIAPDDPDPEHSIRMTTLLQAEKRYREAVYPTLLNKIGTSYEEIRLARSLDRTPENEEDRETLKQLADRLRIDLGSERPGHIAKLFLDPFATATPDALTEEALERLVGLVDTTREPLSEGAKLFDTDGQLKRWNLSGVAWNQNTDPNGRIYIWLRRPAAGGFRVELYRDAARTQLVASGQRLSPAGKVEVSEENGSGLSGAFELNFITGSDDIELSVIPEFFSWRLAHLRTLWQEQDFPTDRYTQGLPPELVEELGYWPYPRPLIDPDVIGPDDFRHPDISAPDRAFQIWVQRREWVDDRLEELQEDRFRKDLTDAEGRVVRDEAGRAIRVPNIEALLDHMYAVDSVSYGDSPYGPAWKDTTPKPELLPLSKVLSEGSKEEIEDAKRRVQDDLNLTVQSFMRLMEVYRKDKLATGDDRYERVEEGEWQEVYSILVQAKKATLFGVWRDDEDTAGLKFGPRPFWASLREPEVGEWSRKLEENRPPVPLIDSEMLKLDDLPEPTAGKSARELWQDRKTLLENYRNVTLVPAREREGFDGILRVSLGDPLPADVDNLYDDLRSSVEADVREAERRITEELLMSVEEFERLMTIRQKEREGDTPPTEAEWEEAYSILTSVYKKRELFPQWIEREVSPAGEPVITYWRAFKAKLPRWRATVEARQQWQQALRNRSSRPIIDPDLIMPVDLKHPIVGDPAFDLWNERRTWIHGDPSRGVVGRLGEFKDQREAPGDDRAWFGAILAAVVGLSTADLEALAEQREQGNALQARLAQLSMDLPAFSHLLRIWRLLSSDPPAPVLDSEWDDVYSILVQVEKRRTSAEWRDEEAGRNMTLGPDSFKIPDLPIEFPPKEPEPLPAWRATWQDRRDWEDTLQSRIEQEQAVLEGLRGAVSATEEMTLPMLRDALVKATGNSGRELTKLLLIDCEMNACQNTTRIAQAIETIQGLLWSLWTGQFRDPRPALTLHAEHFDEEWKWLGAYATWRAAMLAWMYPENILLPHLRGRQTPAFTHFIHTLRDDHRLTPKGACDAANRYAQYIRDVSNLTLEASVYATTIAAEGDCRARASTRDRDLVYIFARGGETNRVYVSWYEPNDPSPYAQSFWEPIRAFDEVDVINIVGAAVYGVTSEERFIYLFVRAAKEGAQKLLYTRFDPQQGIGSGQQAQGLALPEEATEFTAVVKQRNREDEPPHLAIRVPGGAIYGRQMNGEGNGWEDKDFEPLVEGAIARSLHDLHAMIEVSPGQFYLFVAASVSDARVTKYRLFGERDDGSWRLLKGPWIGGFPSTDHVYAVCRFREGGADVAYQSVQPDDPIGHEIRTFREFEGWLYDKALVSLDRISLADFIYSYTSRYFENPDDYEDVKIWASSILRRNGIQSLLDLLERDEARIPQLWLRSRREQLSINTVKSQILSAFANQLDGPNDWVVLWQDWKVADKLVRSLLLPPNGRGLMNVLEMLYRLSIGYYSEVPVFRSRTDRTPLSHGMPGLQRVVHASGSSTGHVAYQRQLSIDRVGVVFDVLYRSIYTPDETVVLHASQQIPIAPVITRPFELTEHLSNEDLQFRRERTKKEFEVNAEVGAPSSVLTYLEEAWYFVPIHIGLQLQRRRQFIAALDWFRTVYDYSYPRISDRNIFFPLRLGYDPATGFAHSEGWLLDPLNPHAITSARGATDTPTSAPAYARFTIISLIRCLLEFADVEFTQDTAESVPRARMLYMTALELLDLPELKPLRGDCEDISRRIDIDSVAPEWRDRVRELRRELTHIRDLDTLEPLVMEINTIIHLEEPMAIRHARIVERISRELLVQAGPSTYGTIVESQAEKLRDAHTALLAYDSVATAAERLGNLTAADVGAALAGVIEHSDRNGQPAGIDRRELPWLRATPGIGSPAMTRVPIADDMPGVAPPGVIGLDTGWPLRLRDDVLTNYARIKPEALFELWRKIPSPFIPIPSYGFCVPPNPLLRALRMHAELNLYKIRTCRNIAGMERALEPYAAPTGVGSGLPIIGESGELTVPVTIVPPPTPYRYEYLIGRAKELADRAGQMEAAFLAALEKRDAEYYNLMKARQDVQLARANLRLQEFRVQEAKEEVTLAELQRERAQIQADHYQKLLREGLNEKEERSIKLLKNAIRQHAAAAAFSTAAASVRLNLSGRFSNIASAASSTAAALSTGAELASIRASYERRSQEWEFQHKLALQDVRIGNQQIRLAQNHAQIVSQERAIGKMQADFAEDTANFLATKFLNGELYEWMSGVLEGVYNVFLQEATAVAKLAEAQLAFEWQQTPPSSIQTDYWEAPSDDAVTETVDGNTPNRRGLTGSARLLADIYKLDQYKFETEKRKLQLTKTISLARLAPAEFQRFRETGIIRFATPMELFDRDFPGHYLRLLKRVRTSVIALIPPTAGIQATLSTTGLSRVMSGSNGLVQQNLIRRSPETVALSSPSDATGVFELTPQSQELLLPFEGMGVDTAWEFRMPKASNLFDYNTIADVLLTIEYAALDSFDYRQQVIRELDSRLSVDRPFSFRQEFADQWYDLHNPEQTATPMVVRFTTRREDFPPNIEDLRIQQVVLYFARKSGASFEIPVTQLHYIESGAGASVGGGATPIDGVISTRRGNAGSWTAMIGKPPIGEWELALPNTEEMKNRFKNEEIEDILFVITYAGHTPAWPA
jgi:hypothetical protein